MAARFFKRFTLVLCATLAATALAVPAASAKTNGLGGLLGGNCPTNGTQVFGQWGDYASYFLAPNGGLENGSAGWSLSAGASVVSGNEPFYVSGSHSLSLPSGSTAVSPVTCIGPQNLYVRMFGADSNGTDSGLHVRVIWYGLLNRVLGVTDYTTFDSGAEWSPTSKLSSAGGFNLLIPLLGSTSARIELTPYGANSNWQIDDLYIDPWASRG